MLDETLVIWGGEFGRTVYCQGRLTATDYGRDHHPRCFTMWLAGGGIKPGLTLGERMITATTSPKIRSTYMICRQPSCSAWVSTTRA